MISISTAATSHFCHSELLSSPSPTQIALSTPVWGLVTFLVTYMNRQMIPAPMNEIAIGRKIIDLAMFSPLARSANTATASPNAVASDVTTRIHHKLLINVPRRVAKHGTGGEEEAEQHRNDGARLGGERLASSSPSDEADHDRRADDGDSNPPQPTAEQPVEPVRGVDELLSDRRSTREDDVSVVCPTDVLLAVAILEREDDGSHERNEQARGHQ